PRLLEGPQEPVARYDGREVINLCSNNYLGLANHARLKAAARRAVDELGVGSGAVRTIAGNMAIHKELEEELARFKHTEATLLYLVALAEECGAIMMVDDAHASGVMGQHGRGTVDHFRLHGRVHIQVGTLSKAFAAQGGYVAGSRTLIDYLIHRARPLLFSTSHPPSVAASALAALRLVQDEPELIERLWDNTRIFKQGLNELGFNTGASETPITPVVVGDEQLATDLSDRLFTAGVFALGIVFPTVPRGKARVRTIVTAAHTRTH